MQVLIKQRANIDNQIEELNKYAKVSTVAGFDFDSIEVEDDIDDMTKIGNTKVNTDLLLDILPIGHSSLRKISQPVPDSMLNSPELDDLIEKMVYTMQMNHGVGLSAPQVDKSLRVVIIENEDEAGEEYVM